MKQHMKQYWSSGRAYCGRDSTVGSEDVWEKMDAHEKCSRCEQGWKEATWERALLVVDRSVDAFKAILRDVLDDTSAFGEMERGTIMREIKRTQLKAKKRAAA